jgi:hypothetical protein
LFWVSGVWCQVSGVGKQMTEDRKQKSDNVLHPQFFSIRRLPSDLCHLSSVICYLTSETSYLRINRITNLLNEKSYGVLVIRQS